MRFSTIMTGAALVISAAMPAGAQTADAQLAQDIDNFVKQIMALNVTPGLSVAVVKGSEPLLVKGYGFADVERQRPVTATTGFYIASVTKTFTALAMKVMEERGQLKLDDPVSKYLPQLQLAAGLSPESITLRDLLTHTHGIGGSGPVVARTAYSGEPTTAAQLIALLREHQPGEAGRNFRYTNVGFNLAGVIIDEVAHDSWKNVLEAELFKPIGMKNTSAFVSLFDSAQLAMPYIATGDGKFLRVYYSKGDGNMHAAGGLISTAEDMAKWLEIQMNGGVLDGKQVISASAIAETQRKIVSLPASTRPDAQHGQGLGWQLARHNGEEALMHGGGFSSFVTMVAFVPAHKIGVAVMVNESKLGGGAGTLIAEYVIDRALGKTGYQATYAGKLEELEGMLQQRRNAIAEDAARRAARPQTLPHPLNAYAGVYENPHVGTIVWEQRGDKLHARWGLLQATAEVYDAVSNKLRVELEPGRGEIIEFKFADGKATSIVYGGREFTKINRPNKPTQ